MSTLFHPHVTCVWGDFLIGLGTEVRAFKPSWETFQVVGECTNHLHHVHHSGISILISRLITCPNSPIISRSSWPLRSCTVLCSQLLAIWSSMLLKSAIITHISCSRTSLWSWAWLGTRFKPAHRLIMGIQHPLVHHILLLLHLELLTSKISYNWIFGLYKLYFFSDISKPNLPSAPKPSKLLASTRLRRTFFFSSFPDSATRP